MRQARRRRKAGLWRLAIVVLAVAAATPPAARAAEPVKVALVAALSGQSAKSGEGITRGLTIAIEEINARGGVLGGRKIELIRRDDEANPAKGQIAAREVIHQERVAALITGIETPVALAILPIIQKEKVPMMGVWAAGTAITRGSQPNFSFRVSAVDELVDKALVKYAMKTFGSKNLGLIRINNPWGESNEKGLNAAVSDYKVQLVGVEKFEQTDVDMVPQLSRLKAAGADTIILIGSAAPGAQVIKALDRMNWEVPIVSHWGISGGRFAELAGPSAKKVHFIQTYSFFGKQNEVGQKVLAALKAKYPDIKGPGDAIPPVGIANAYDAMMLLAMAIDKAGSTDGDRIRQAFYQIGPYRGLIKNYTKPFSSQSHDALNEDDYIMVRYEGEQIIPAK
jgi:branched-chain amino acid transport system substrate-binding protein